MSQKLYQQLIISHNRQPIGKDKVFPYSHSALGENPSCGDELNLYIELSHQQINDIGFNSDACAICTASASLLCQQVQSKTLAQASELSQQLSAWLQQKTTQPQAFNDDNPLQALSGVSHFPSRINCALLPWHTLDQIADNQTKTAIA